jgi:hypothetical protein
VIVITFIQILIVVLTGHAGASVSTDKLKIEIYLIEKIKKDASVKQEGFFFLPESSDLSDSPFINDHEISSYEILDRRSGHSNEKQYYVRLNESGSEKLKGDVLLAILLLYRSPIKK